jgi:hypothetical protein
VITDTLAAVTRNKSMASERITAELSEKSWQMNKTVDK